MRLFENPHISETDITNSPGLFDGLRSDVTGASELTLPRPREMETFTEVRHEPPEPKSLMERMSNLARAAVEPNDVGVSPLMRFGQTLQAVGSSLRGDNTFWQRQMALEAGQRDAAIARDLRGKEFNLREQEFNDRIQRAQRRDASLARASKRFAASLGNPSKNLLDIYAELAPDMIAAGDLSIAENYFRLRFEAEKDASLQSGLTAYLEQLREGADPLKSLTGIKDPKVFDHAVNMTGLLHRESADVLKRDALGVLEGRKSKYGLTREKAEQVLGAGGMNEYQQRTLAERERHNRVIEGRSASGGVSGEKGLTTAQRLGAIDREMKSLVSPITGKPSASNMARFNELQAQRSALLGESGGQSVSPAPLGAEHKVRPGAPLPSSPAIPAGRIRVRDRATGQTGTIEAREFDSKRYERVQ